MCLWNGMLSKVAISLITLEQEGHREAAFACPAPFISSRIRLSREETAERLIDTEVTHIKVRY
jgi:hypothetical protein